MKKCNRCEFNGKCTEACLKCQGGECYRFKYSKYIDDCFDAKQESTEGSGQVTSLPDEREDVMRKFLFNLFDLSYNEIQVMKGIMNQKTLQEIADDISRNSKKNQTVSRHKVFQERKAILKKLGEDFTSALMTSGQRKELKG